MISSTRPDDFFAAVSVGDVSVGGLGRAKEHDEVVFGGPGSRGAKKAASCRPLPTAAEAEADAAVEGVEEPAEPPGSRPWASVTLGGRRLWGAFATC